MKAKTPRRRRKNMKTPHREPLGPEINPQPSCCQTTTPPECKHHCKSGSHTFNSLIRQSCIILPDWRSDLSTASWNSFEGNRNWPGRQWGWISVTHLFTWALAGDRPLNSNCVCPHTPGGPQSRCHACTPPALLGRGLQRTDTRGEASSSHRRSVFILPASRFEYTFLRERRKASWAWPPHSWTGSDSSSSSSAYRYASRGSRRVKESYGLEKTNVAASFTRSPVVVIPDYAFSLGCFRPPSSHRLFSSKTATVWMCHRYIQYI